MRVIVLAAGAASMICGSCLRDNRLAATLRGQGRDVRLLPLYTPIHTDEQDVSEPTVLFGGVRVYLRQKSAIFRMLPSFLTHWLDSPAILRSVGRLAAQTRPQDVGELTVSVLQADLGRQKAEFHKLLAALYPLAPDVVVLPNLMFLGIAHRIRLELGCDVVCTLSGEDLFLDELPSPHREHAFQLIAKCARDADGFLATSKYYAQHCSEHFGLPGDRIFSIPLGVRLDDALERAEPAGLPFRMVFVGRIAREKGLHNLATALIHLRNEGRDCRLDCAGWLGAANRPYLLEVEAQIRKTGHANAFTYRGEVDRARKIELLASAHVFSIPTDYREAKGLPVLEANALGVPVVQPRHGSFPELVERTGGGLLYDPGDAHGLKNALARLMDDSTLRQSLGAAGAVGVRTHFTDEVMAAETWKALEQVRGWKAGK